MISESMLAELIETTTHRRKWWAIKFETGFCGEIIDEEEEQGFDFKLFNKKEQALNYARGVTEGEDVPFEIVEICFAEVK